MEFLIFFALLVSAAASFIMYRLRDELGYASHGRALVVWLSIPFVVSLLLTGMCYLWSGVFFTAAKEYRTGVLQSVKYVEPWNEEVSYTYIDSNGNPKTSTRVDFHPAQYRAATSLGDMYIDRTVYDKFTSKWNNSMFINMHRRYYTRNGNVYVSTRPTHDYDSSEVVTSTYTYTNRVIASRSDFNNFIPITDEDAKKYGLHSYPEVQNYLTVPSTLGDFGALLNGDTGKERLEIVNSVVGPEKHCRIWVLLYDSRTTTRGTGIQQENYWKKGAQNELVVCLGVTPDGVLKWSHVFSWTDAKDLIVDLQTNLLELNERQLDYYRFVETIHTKVRSSYKWKDMDKDFSMLTIEPTKSTILVFVLLIMAANAGVGVGFAFICAGRRDYYL